MAKVRHSIDCAIFAKNTIMLQCRKQLTGGGGCRYASHDRG
jgi:hypothetical protein